MPAALAAKTAERRAGMRPPKAEPNPPSGAGPDLGAIAGMPAFLQRKSNHRGNGHGTGIDSSDDEEELLGTDALPKSIQAKAVIGAPDDPLEHEADRVAEAAVSRGPSATRLESGSAQGGCACGTCDSCRTKKDQIQRSTVAGSSRASIGTATLPGVDAGLPLSSNVRERVEPVLGVNLGGVRVHSGEAAGRAAQAINARAFTYQSHIWLGPNERSDDTELLAHEAAHVVQQSGNDTGLQTLQRKEATDDGEGPRQRILGRIHEELGDDAEAVESAARPRRGEVSTEQQPAADGEAASQSQDGPAATARAPEQQIDRGELAAKKGELEPEAHPDVDRPAEIAPQVKEAAQQTTTQADTPGDPLTPEQEPKAEGEGSKKSPAVAAAEQAAGQADVAFSAATSQMQPPEPPVVEPPRQVEPVDSKGAPVLTDPTLDNALIDVAEQAQTLRQEGLNLRQHAAEERANAELLRGNLALVEQGVGQAEQGVATSNDHLAYRREVADTAQQSLDVSKEKAQTVADQAPGYAEQADEGKAKTGPMASEASEVAGESAANTPDDDEAAADAQEQSGKINQASSDISSTDDAIEQTQARAATLQEDAAHAAEVNTATEERLASVDATLTSTEERLASMEEQNSAARGQMDALSSEPDALLAQADALDQQGQQMLDASTAIEDRLHGAQDTHQSSLQSLPEIREAPPDAVVQAASEAPSDMPEAIPAEGAVAGPPANGNPEDYRYEDRASVDLASHLPSWFSGADPVSAEERAEAEQRERERRAREVQEITDMAGGDVASIGSGQRAWIALRMTGRHLFGSVSGIRWPGWGHLALGLIDPRGPLMGVVSGLSMMLSGGANLLSGEQWRRDPLGNLLKSAADIATGLTIILGSITALAGVIIAIMGAITLLSLGTAAPVTGPIIAFCASVMTTVGGWTLTVGEVALVLQGLVLIKNLIDAACVQTAEQLQNQSDKITTDVGNAGNVVMQMGMAKLAQVGGRAMQAEIAEAGGGVNFARTVGGVRTTGAGSYARAVGGVARAAPGRILRGAAGLATREGRGRAWAGIKGMFRSEGEPMSAREGFSRDFLVGRREPVPVPAGEAGAAAPRVAPPAGEAGAVPRPAARPPETPPPRAEPALPEPPPRAAEPESGAARDRSVEASGHVESQELSHQQLANETKFIEDNPHLVQEGPPRSIKIGEHEWTENPGGGWCRHSNGSVCVPRLRVNRGPELTPENVDDIIAELRSKRTVSPAEEARLRAVAEQPGGIWNLRAELGEAGSPALRGEVGHQLLGEELPYAATIDSAPRIDPATGLATEVRSIKTHQLYAFQEEGSLAAQLEAEARELSRFKTTPSGTGTRITAAPGADRVLVIGVPPDTLEATAGRTLTAQWRAEASQAIAYARGLKPPVRIVFKTIR